MMTFDEFLSLHGVTDELEYYLCLQQLCILRIAKLALKRSVKEIDMTTPEGIE